MVETIALQKDSWDIFQALSPFLVGVVALFLAALQLRTAEKQRQQTLFAARYDAYEKILFIINHVMMRGGVTGIDEKIINEINRNFFNLNQQFRFLFSKESQAWLDRFYKIYLVFQERDGLGERVTPEQWKMFRDSVEQGFLVVQEEMKVV